MIKLNKKQEEAANFLNGICVVIAVPGSGKTLTMTERIGNLVKNHNISPENILGLTFTRNAAETMRTLLTPVLEKLATRVMLSTIHSFCHYLLRQEGKVFEVLSGKEQLIFLRNIIKRLRVKDISLGTVLCEISLSKNNLIDVDEYRTLYSGDTTMQKVADIWESYDVEKGKKMLMDFDDLLINTHKLLSEKQEIHEKYKGTYKHLLVDEFQDTNPLQMEIFKLLIDDTNNDCSVWFTGDDWQSIYAFTGASVNNILNFKKMYPKSKQFILHTNYRSTPQILKACQNLIKHNKQKIEKELKTDNADGEDVIFLESSSEEAEALYIVNEIKDLTSRGFKHKDIAILYRANFQSRIIEEYFSQHKIPYHIENGLNFYQRREIKVLLDYMRINNNPLSDEGDEALINVINIPNRYIGRKFIAELERFSEQNNIHLYDGLKNMPIDLPYIRKNVKELVEFLEPLIIDSKNIQPAELIQLIRNSLYYDRYISDEDIPSPDDTKIENINQLQLSATKYSSIDAFLQYTDSFKEVASNDKEGVSLMTVHKSKGLEFPVVFVIGMVEGILPTKMGDIEEERRICFVAISRAMKLLYLSYSNTYLGQPSNKSIFINEILGNS